MDVNTVIAFEFKKEERTYRFELPHGCPLGEAYEAANNFLLKMVEMINEHAESTKQKEDEESIEVSEEETKE